MPKSDPVNWQPISQMPLIASMIDSALEDTREHLATLTKGPSPINRIAIVGRNSVCGSY